MKHGRLEGELSISKSVNILSSVGPLLLSWKKKGEQKTFSVAIVVF